MARHLSRGQPKGQKHSKAKLAEKDVRDILSRLGEGELQQALADEYQVSRSNISRIKTGNTWAHLGGAEVADRVGSERASAKLTETDVVAILNQVDGGGTLSEVARAFKVSRTTVADIWHGRRWTHVPRQTRKNRRPVYDDLY